MLSGFMSIRRLNKSGVLEQAMMTKDEEPPVAITSVRWPIFDLIKSDIS